MSEVATTKDEVSETLVGGAPRELCTDKDVSVDKLGSAAIMLSRDAVVLDGSNEVVNSLKDELIEVSTVAIESAGALGVLVSNSV